MIEKPTALNWVKCTIGIAIICYFFSYYKNQDVHYIILNLNLIFHEAGHTLFRWAPELIYIAAGSFFQILFPIIFVGYFAMRREFYSASVLGFWVATNLLGVARYVADADVMQLDLLGGDNVIHDWNYILGHFSLLNHAETIGMVVGGLGFLVAGASAVGVLYFSFKASRLQRWE